MASKYLTEWWKPRDDIAIIFDDKTAAARTPEQIDDFFEEIRDVARKHGFDIHTWGSTQNMHDWLTRLLQKQ